MSPIFHKLDDKVSRDNRGWVANPFLIPDFPAKYGHLHTVSLNAGVARGNHFHRKCQEWLFIFGGAYSVHWREDGTVQSRRFEADEYYTIEIPPSVVHAVRNESNSMIYLISYQNAGMAEVRVDTEPAVIVYNERIMKLR